MPKIIKDIEETIMNSALDLFGEFGYDGVDMKMIAQKSGIAVGTLYNYYANKKDLFLNVFEKSWHKTFQRLDEVKNLSLPPMDILKNYIKVLYEDIEGRKGLGKELIKINLIEPIKDKRLVDYRKHLLSDIEEMIKAVSNSKLKNKDYNAEARLSDIIFIVITALLDGFAGEKENNLDFIYTILDGVVSSAK